MAENSKIEWTTHTFNPWIGCTRVSQGCVNCYAETLMADRYQKVKWGPKGQRHVTSGSYWKQPLKWNREAEGKPHRPRVFCASLADVFEDWKGKMTTLMKETCSEWRWSPMMGLFLHGWKTPEQEGERAATMQDWRNELWALIECTPNLDWLILTKRPENVMRMAPERWQEAFPRNVWIGTSCEDQKTADERIPHLLRVPAAVRFLSCEPLIGPIDLAKWFGVCISCGASREDPDGNTCICDDPPHIHWVICGGESGPNSRVFDPQWAYSLMVDCKAAGVPFFMKQMGSNAFDHFNDLKVVTGDKKGSTWGDNYRELRVREFPEITK